MSSGSRAAAEAKVASKAGKAAKKVVGPDERTPKHVDPPAPRTTPGPSGSVLAAQAKAKLKAGAKK